ncbi:MAG TPA: zinc dependent phospholipase C family protein [Deltaproteobacteria bacterium]|nr:zinc dependent phospholipase C family protein [Deltaproteobacteria bacterium]HPP81436.1 zinc dependent phospholipase C family protein [Deltaproteobacteria bacterium]
MPKENTHLWFAYSMLGRSIGADMLRTVSSHLSSYLLGSVMPDTFYYSPRRELVSISETFHGRDGNPTNTLVFKVLDAGPDQADLAFVLGFLTHCALDIAFHPVVYFLTGNYYDPDPARKAQAVRLHRRLETSLDAGLSHGFMLHRIIRPWHTRGLALEAILARDFGARALDVRCALARQAAFNLAFRSAALYRVAVWASRRTRAVPQEALGLFYADAGDARFPETIEAQDLVVGAPYTTSAGELFDKAGRHAAAMMNAAWAFACGRTTRRELEEAIPGASLDTGMVGVSVAQVRHTSAP